MKKQNEAVLKNSKANKWLVIALCAVSALFILTATLWATSESKRNNLNASIENVYERNFYDLIDNINNAEVKLGKVLASDFDSYSEKILNEIGKNANSASYNLSNLPISLGGIDETKKFINQVGGFSESLAQKLDRGEKLTTAEIDALEEIHYSIISLKNNLLKFNDDLMVKGFNIFNESNLTDGDFNNFTLKIQGIKTSDVDYPTMIYDGPFSDSEYNKEIKGLPQEEVSVQEAKNAIKNTYLNASDENIKYIAETNGKFKTFDFSVELSNNISAYIQVTKNGGKILTVSGFGDGELKNISLNEAISKAKQIAKKQTGTNFDCVWSDIVSNDAYINLAPVESGIIIYPDLIKLKVDLSSGEIVGYNATAYYTNHTIRQISDATYSKENANKKVPANLKVEMSRLCLAPLSYGKETLCYEYKCLKNAETYYVYINANSGITENILKVVETSNGNKLM